MQRNLAFTYKAKNQRIALVFCFILTNKFFNFVEVL